MGKHSKNNNERAFFSHAERQAAKYGRHSSGLLGGHNTAGGNFVDTGWGSHKRTLDSDAMKDLDACSLTLVPCVDPVITPKGVVYDKQVIYQYILDRKAEIERELRAWTAQQEAEAAGAASEAARAADQRVEEFVARQEGLSKSDLASRRPSDPSSSGGAVGALMGARAPWPKGGGGGSSRLGVLGRPHARGGHRQARGGHQLLGPAADAAVQARCA